MQANDLNVGLEVVSQHNSHLTAMQACCADLILCHCSLGEQVLGNERFEDAGFAQLTVNGSIHKHLYWSALLTYITISKTYVECFLDVDIRQQGTPMQMFVNGPFHGQQGEACISAVSSVYRHRQASGK